MADVSSREVSSRACEGRGCEVVPLLAYNRAVHARSFTLEGRSR